MNSDLRKAIDMLQDGHYTCVLCKNDIIYTSTERGVKPLLEWMDRGIVLKDFSAADKVVGKAAAFLYVLFGVEEVYASVMSERAIETLKANGIRVNYKTSVSNIKNRTGKGFCPMEEAVRNISVPSEALETVRKTLKELNKLHTI